MQTVIMFFMRMFAVFFARVNPASTSEKPACIKDKPAAEQEPDKGQGCSEAVYRFCH